MISPRSSEWRLRETSATEKSDYSNRELNTAPSATGLEVWCVPRLLSVATSGAIAKGEVELIHPRTERQIQRRQAAGVGVSPTFLSVATLGAIRRRNSRCPIQ